MPFCQNCGNEVKENQAVCLKCGVAIPANKSAGSIASDLANGTHNKYVAAVLAFLLGGFGIHKFYLGQIGLGIVYILFSWTFIPMIVSLVEAVLYLSMSDADFANKYH